MGYGRSSVITGLIKLEVRIPRICLLERHTVAPNLCAEFDTSGALTTASYTIYHLAKKVICLRWGPIYGGSRPGVAPLPQSYDILRHSNPRTT